MLKRIAFVFFAAMPLCFAQGTAPRMPEMVTGTVTANDGKTLSIKTQNEQVIALTLAPKVNVMANKSGSIADIKPDVFLGTTAVKQADGRLHATEVHIFPESMRGAGEGHYPWGTQADTTMTNGSVSGPTMTNGNVQSQSQAGGGTTIKVMYKGGEQEIIVSPEVPVGLIVQADLSQLTPGTLVSAFTQRAPDGGLITPMVNIGPPPAAPK